MTKSKSIFGFGGFCLMVACLAVLQFASGDQKLCGESLNQAVELICPGGFNAYKTKRSSLSPEDGDISGTEDEDNFNSNLDLWPFLARMQPNSLAKIRRRRHGITHECCAKACSVSEIKSYCRREAFS